MSPAEHDLLKDVANLSVLLLGVGMIIFMLAARVLPGGLTQRYGKIKTEELGLPELFAALALILVFWLIVIVPIKQHPIFPILVLLGIVYFMGFIRKHDLVQFFGLTRLRPGKVIAWGVLTGVGSTVVAWVLMWVVTTLFLKHTMGEVPQQEALQVLKKELLKGNVSIAVLLFVQACLYAPILEEFIFRGFLYPALKRYSLPLVAAVVVSGIFAAVHVNVGATVSLIFFALVLTMVYELTGCLWVAVVAHAVFNLCNLGLAILTVQTPS